MINAAKMWAVVYVWRGFPDKVELFVQEESAWKRQNEIKKEISIEDEVAVIQVSVPR